MDKKDSWLKKGIYVRVINLNTFTVHGKYSPIGTVFRVSSVEKDHYNNRPTCWKQGQPRGFHITEIAPLTKVSNRFYGIK